MSKQYKPYSPRQAFLLPPSPSEWLPADHLAYFILDLLEQLDISAIERLIQAKDPRGTKPYAPRMMLALLLYGYCTGVFSSRRIARATHDDVAFRVLAAGHHPHFTVINDFRKQFLNEIAALFLQVLLLCRQAGLVKLGHVALDGTKLQANASKHKAMSYERMVELEKRLKDEIEALMGKAEQADAEEDVRLGAGQDEQDIPAELARREQRLAKLQQAKAELEAEARKVRAERLRELAQDNDERAQNSDQPRERKQATTRAAKQRAQAEQLDPAQQRHDDDDDDAPPFTNGDGLALHRVPVTPDGKPKPKAQRNFTDPDSRIVELGGSFLQGYNAQAVVDEAHQVIIATSLTNQSPDAGNLAPMLELVVSNLGEAPAVLSADSGFWNASVVEDTAAHDTELLIATERHKHWEYNREVTQGVPPEDLDARAAMRWKMRTREARELYARRKVIAEPPFGQIKEVRGFRRFSLRGLQQATHEWSLVCLTHNLLKLFRAGGMALLPSS